ncbi:trypsin-like serine peptidase [Pelomonas aquatica]|jgi:hypothetical protein|nr:serine protease [Pelomonas aquatica]MCY4754460.1 serine protease [Pelomonas aquatica]
MTHPEMAGEKDEASTLALIDPEQELTRGERLRFSAQRLLFEGTNDHHMMVGALNGTLLALSFRDDYGHHTYGSGVMVGPGLALCAAHVLYENDFYVKLQNGGATLVAQAPLSDGGMLLWTVQRMTLVPDSDLAILSMSLTSRYPEDRHFMTAWMTTRMPAVGEVLTVTGYSASGGGTVPIARRTRLEMFPQCQLGAVIDRYPNGRGSLLPGPCLAVDCAVPGGTSGGPVFDSKGYLVGLLSTSYEGEDKTSFVSHIWPALVRANTEPVWPPAPYPRPSMGSLLRLGSAFGVSIERPDAFRLCAPAGTVSLQYVAWEDSLTLDRIESLEKRLPRAPFAQGPVQLVSYPR